MSIVTSARGRFAAVSQAAANGFERAIPGLKKFGKGALCAAALFPVCAYAMGYVAGVVGVPVPQANTSDLQAAASQYAPFLEEVSDDH